MAADVPDRVLQPVLSVARQIVSGELHPYQGAAAIWARLAEEQDEYPDELKIFVGLASEWQDQPDHREAYESDIREEAAELLDRYRG